jgi:hypothetical protein
MKRTLALAFLIPLVACSGLPGLTRDEEPPRVIEAVTAGGPVSVSADPTQSSATEPRSERFLGFSVTSLGDASVPGLWLETPLVRTEMTGSVVAENGRQIALILRPSGGARGSGSRLSLEGFRALGMPLTSVSTLTVIGDV